MTDHAYALLLCEMYEISVIADYIKLAITLRVYRTFHINKIYAVKPEIIDSFENVLFMDTACSEINS